jgi:uncharacterized protein YigE (DUF2233 family)
MRRSDPTPPVFPHGGSRAADESLEGKIAGCCSRRVFLRGMAVAAASLAFGGRVLADGPPITTRSIPFGGDNHVFITSARHDRYYARVVTAREVLGRTFATTAEILAATGAFVCFNGSFFEADGSPSGLFVSGGSYKNPVIHDKGDGILYIDRSRRIHVISKYRYAEHRENIVDALQINLFTEGDLKLYEDKTYRRRLPRNLIGMTEDRLVDVIYKDTNFTYGDRYMKDAHGCTVVGALDGGSSASAVDKLGGSSYRESRGDRPEAAVPNFIVLYER